MPVADVNDRLDLSLPEEECDAAGGFVFGTLGRVPEVGDEVVVAEGALRVVAMDGRRVARIAYVPDPDPQPGD